MIDLQRLTVVIVEAYRPIFYPVLRHAGESVAIWPKAQTLLLEAVLRHPFCHCAYPCGSRADDHSWTAVTAHLDECRVTPIPAPVGVPGTRSKIISVTGTPFKDIRKALCVLEHISCKSQHGFILNSGAFSPSLRKALPVSLWPLMLNHMFIHWILLTFGI